MRYDRTKFPFGGADRRLPADRNHTRAKVPMGAVDTRGGGPHDTIHQGYRGPLRDSTGMHEHRTAADHGDAAGSNAAAFHRAIGTPAGSSANTAAFHNAIGKTANERASEGSGSWDESKHPRNDHGEFTNK